MTTPDLHTLRERAALVRALPAGEPVPSPCVSVCRMDAQRQWCEGCHRSIDEITHWRRTDDDGKRAIWQRIEQRVQALP